MALILVCSDPQERKIDLKQRLRVIIEIISMKLLTKEVVLVAKTKGFYD